jgi:hypothetical protein
MRQYKQPSLHFIYDEPFQQIDERAHEFRTYNAGINRLAKSLEKAQTWAEKQMGLARATGENTEAIERRHNHIIKQRRATLSALHPTWTPEDTNRWVYAQRPTETPYLDIKEQQRNAAERMAERDATRQTMMQAAKGLRDQGIKGRDAIRMLELAEWTPQEAQQILSWA